MAQSTETEARGIRLAIVRYLDLAAAWMANLAGLEGDNTLLDVAASVRKIADLIRPPAPPVDWRYEHKDERRQ